MSNILNNEILRIVFIILLIVVGGYVIGRAFSKGFIKELDLYLAKKFTDYINNKKTKENGNEKKE